jgi:uncharacterized repeat protein (TIGR01451 family)
VPFGIPITPPYAEERAPHAAFPNLRSGIPHSEPWAPPGIALPWPPDEYLCDGGDTGLPARVTPDWQVHGLEQEDTIVHYDTLDGRTVVEPTNRVCLYAPRFGSVRSVTGVVEHEHANGPEGVDQPLQAIRYDEVLAPSMSQQREQLAADIARYQAGAYVTRQGDGQLSEALLPHGYDGPLSLAKEFAFLRQGTFEQAEKARLAAAVEAAIVWSNVQAVQIILDGRLAREEAGVQQTHSVYVVDDLRPPGRLRVCKVASTKEALPGEIVEFAIRFDNVGGHAIGNVTIVDNLTTRLEYIPGTAQSTLAGEFLTEENEAGSLVLRWEVADPLEPGQGGNVSFQCLVR